MMFRSVGMLLLAVLAIKIAVAASDCLEPDTRVVGRWKNGNFYKGVVESLTNTMNVLFDNGNRLNYNLHSKYDVVEDRIPEQNEIKWGDPVVVNRPHSFAFQPAHIREIVGGRYMVWYKDGSYIYQTKKDIRVFNKSAVCNEPAYLGCYRDQVPRYVTVFIPTRPATIAACVDMCNAQSYSIAALRNSDLCFCGNSYNKGYQTSDKRCDMPCYDNPYEKCGGVSAFSQYWTGIVGDKPVYRPSGLEAYTEFHMDPYGFQRTYQSVIRKQSIPRFGKLPWSNILQARKAVRKPSSLAHSSPWRWNALRSTWIRADGKQFRWKHLTTFGSKKNYRTWTGSQTPLTRNGWTWNGRAWVSAAKMSTALQQSHHPYPKVANPFSKSTYGKVASKPTYYNKGYLKATDRTRDTNLYPYNTMTPNYANILKPYSNVDISKYFTPNLVLQKLADRMRTVKWSQLSNFKQLFKPSSSIPLTFRYLGCFSDDYQRDLPFQYSMPTSSLTVRSCVLKCRENSFSVAGLQGSTQCFCGNTYSKYGRVREEECRMKCGASTTDICGGILRNSIYYTGIGSAWPAHRRTKTKASNNSSTHAQSKANDKEAKKVTSAIDTKYGKTTSLSKHKVTKTFQKDSKLSSKKKEVKKTQRNKNKARNKINDAPKKLPEKENSGIDDFQVESIKVKVNFSELKKALQTLSPEIVRRVQKDLSRMHKKEHSNHTREKVNVELEETKQDNDEEYDEEDVKRIRNEIHNKALDHLTNENIKEILRIMKIPKNEIKGERSGKSFEDAIKSIHAARKKGMERNGIKVVNGKDVTHEEIESYSRISLDFPLRLTKGASKTSIRKEASKDKEERKSHEKSKLKVKPTKKNTKEKSRSRKVKSVRKVSNKKVHSTKMNYYTVKKLKNDVKNVTRSNPRKDEHLKANINAKTTGSNDVQRLDVQSHKPNSKAGSPKVNTVAKTSSRSNERIKAKQTHSSTMEKASLSEKDLNKSKNSLTSKPVIHMAGGNKKMKEKNAVKNALKVEVQPDVPAVKSTHSGEGKASLKMNHDRENKQISKDGDLKKAEGVKRVETGKASIKMSSDRENKQISKDRDLKKAEGVKRVETGKASLKMSSGHKTKQITKVDGNAKTAEGVKSVETGPKTRILSKPPPSQNSSAALPPSSEDQNKVKDIEISKAQGTNNKNEKDQSSAKGSKEGHEDKQITPNKLPGNDDEKVKKSQSQSKANDNGVIYLGNAAKKDDKSQQKQDEKSQNNPSDQEENLQLNVVKEGDENGVIYLGGAAKQLQNAKKNDEKKEDEKVPHSKEKVKEVKLDKEDEAEMMSPSDSEKKEKKTKDKVNTLMAKTNYDGEDDKKKQTEAKAATKEKEKDNDNKGSKVTKKHKHNDSEKEQHSTRIVKENNDKMSSKENEQKRTASKKVKTKNSDSVADLKPGTVGKEDVDLAQSNKVIVPQNSLQVTKQSQPQLSASQPDETQNDEALTDRGSGADASGSNSDASETPFEQENKLLSFQKQNSINGKSSNAALQKGSSGNSLGNINNTKGKAEDRKQIGVSGMSDAEKVTESKIITKLNNLLNSGSGDDNFEDVVNELEKNKIDGISANGITIMRGQGSGRISTQEKSVRRPQYSDSSGLMDTKIIQSGGDMNRMGGKPIGEDKYGNVGTTTSASNDQKIRNLPTKAMALENSVDLGSGLEDVNSGELSTKYTYFGSGAAKEDLPLIRADDLKRLTQEQRRHSFENSGYEAQPSSGLQGESIGKKRKPKFLHPKGKNQRLYAKSSIPTPPIYKMIMIPKLTLSTEKKTGKEKRVKNARNLKFVLGGKNLSKMNPKAKKSSIAKMNVQINKKKNLRKHVQGESQHKIKKKESSKSQALKKNLSKEKYYSNVKGIRVVKNGVSFTVSKGQSNPSPNSRPLKGEISSTRNIGETTKTNHLKDNKLKLHHISERRKKVTKKDG